MALRPHIEPSPTDPLSLAGRRSRHWNERAIEGILLLCALASIVTTVGIVVVLATETWSFFADVSVVEFFTETRWTPLFKPAHFGVAPLVVGTLLVTVGAASICIPLGLGSAIFLSEYAPQRVRDTLKPLLEVLAGIPTVVYGFFALTLVTPFLRNFLPGLQVFNAVSASLVMGIMILPMVASLSEDAMSAVPRSLREAAYGLGATKFEVSTRVVVPAALSGIGASFVLAISRALGETMIVTLAAGATPKLTFNPQESIQAMTAYIVQVGLGDTPAGTIEYKTIFAVAATLFVMTLMMNILNQWLLARFREAYE